MNKQEMETAIKLTLEKIRPYIQRDGGDVEYVDVDENGIVSVKMLGACASCLALDSTLSDGIESILIDEVEGVYGVRLHEENPYETI
ncbi:MAG: NifU family protein [Anaerorhabdus sp.]